MMELIDTIFGPVQEVLIDVLTKLQTVSLVASRGIDLDKYLGWYSQLGSGWVMLFKMVVSSLLLLVTVYFAKRLYNVYLMFKEGVRWW